MKHCRICGSNSEFLESVLDCRYEQVDYRDKPFILATKEIMCYRCEKCGHIQTEPMSEAHFYDTYSPWQGAAQYSGAFDKTESKLQRLYDKARGSGDVLRYLEVGCGTGKALLLAQSLFAECIGVEPSQTAKLACKKGCTVLQNYFDSSLGLRSEFNAVAAFQVFEHLDDPNSILQAMYDALVPGGVGLINVPNGDMIYTNALYHQVISEHINYYTPSSLAEMISHSEFELLEISDNHDTIELDVYFRKPHIAARDKSRFTAAREFDRQELNRQLSGCHAITIWGAGAKAVTYSQLLSPELPIVHLIDSSPDKIGLYTSGLPLPIEPVSAELLDACDTVLIFASSYNREILCALKEKFSYHGAVVFFENGTIAKCQL